MGWRFHRGLLAAGYWNSRSPVYTRVMGIEPTEIQGGAERRRASEMSLKRGRPPTQVPGYEPERFLGVGAYGEVWVAVERNTGRRVAIKFYAHRGGLDWSLLSREVEKLAFLFADRYVVQLLGVGWDADPPYYIMEYLERGSLADRIAEGPLPVEDAVATLRGVATGLVHAARQGRAALRPEAGQRLAGPGRQAAAGRFWAVAALDRAGAGVGDDVLHGPGASGFGGRARCPLGRLRLGGASVLHVDGRPAASDGRDGGRVRADARPGAAASPLPAVDRAVAAAGGASEGAGRGQNAGGHRQPLSGRGSEQAVCQRAGRVGCLGRSGVAVWRGGR